MKRHLSLSLLILALALPLRGQGAITVVPAAPTSADAIELRVPFCFPDEPPVVERSGFEIKITFGDSMCGDPPIPGQQEVLLPPLPPGEYHVEVYDSTAPEQGLVAAGTFVVTEAERLVDVRPSVIPTAPGGLEVFFPYDDPLAAFCPGECTFRIGGVEVDYTLRSVSAYEYIVLKPPPHAAGFVDLEISNGTQTQVLKNALYYFDRAAAPDLAVFERVLFPVLFSARGGHGSDWQSEALMASTSRVWHVPTFSDGAFRPDEVRTWPGQPQYPHGTAMLVPRSESDQLWFALRVRDVSRVAEGFGTEIPVVRESQMFPGTMTLLDVPLDPAYRVKLRIYAYGDMETDDLGRISGFGTFAMHRSCSGPASCAATPWFAEVDLPVRGDDERANLYVTPPAGASLAWAFATVTNNATQQVTVATPDGTGGEPCTPCTIP